MVLAVSEPPVFYLRLATGDDRYRAMLIKIPSAASSQNTPVRTNAPTRLTSTAARLLACHLSVTGHLSGKFAVREMFCLPTLG